MRGARGPPLIRFFAVFFFFFFRGSEAPKTSKADNYQPASETPLKWRFAGGAIMAHIEFWLGSFSLNIFYFNFVRYTYKYIQAT